jgi:hypothetical protein
LLLRLLWTFSNELLYNLLVGPSHESNRLNTIATETGGIAVLFHTVKLISDLSSNDVIHNLFGPAVRFGTVADLGSPIFSISLMTPTQTTLSGVTNPNTPRPKETPAHAAARLELESGRAAAALITALKKRHS